MPVCLSSNKSLTIRPGEVKKTTKIKRLLQKCLVAAVHCETESNFCGVRYLYAGCLISRTTKVPGKWWVRKQENHFIIFLDLTALNTTVSALAVCCRYGTQLLFSWQEKQNKKKHQSANCQQNHKYYNKHSFSQKCHKKKHFINQVFKMLLHIAVNENITDKLL